MLSVKTENRFLLVIRKFGEDVELRRTREKIFDVTETTLERVLEKAKIWYDREVNNRLEEEKDVNRKLLLLK